MACSTPGKRVPSGQVCVGQCVMYVASSAPSPSRAPMIVIHTPQHGDFFECSLQSLLQPGGRRQAEMPIGHRCFSPAATHRFRDMPSCQERIGLHRCFGWPQQASGSPGCRSSLPGCAQHRPSVSWRTCTVHALSCMGACTGFLSRALIDTECHPMITPWALPQSCYCAPDLSSR